MEKERNTTIKSEGSSSTSESPKNIPSVKRGIAAGGSGIAGGFRSRHKPSKNRSEEVERSTSSSKSCFCNLVVSGPKLCCVKCERIYHARCLGIPASKIDKIGSFFCPVCDKATPNSKSALDLLDKSKRIIEKEKEKKQRDDVLKANYKQVVHRVNQHRRPPQNNDLEKAIQLSLDDQNKHESEKIEESESKIKLRSSSAPSVLKDSSSQSLSPTIVSPLNRKALKDKKKKGDKISRRLQDALDDSIITDEFMRADDERLIEYMLQLSIVEHEKTKEAAERKALVEAQDIAYQEALLLDQEKERLQQEEELRERLLNEEIEKARRDFELQEIEKAQREFDLQEIEKLKQQEEEERIRKENEEKQKIEEKRNLIPTEPETGPNVVELTIRLPDGVRISRKFTYSNTITNVKNWIKTKLAVNTINNFELISDFPRKIYNEEAHTLEQAGLVHKTLLSIKATDER